VPGLGAGRLAVGEPATVVSAGDVGSHLLLLSGIPPEARRAFRDRVLGPVLAYDHAHGADLVYTLDVFLNCAGSWSRAATRLHLHVNTLRYRIGRVEQLTGRDLSRFPDRVDFYLALRLPR
jgi:DNA-binding PucR family transcriptional regulator